VGHTAPPQIVADNFPSPAHNQCNQKAMPLPILNHGPLTAEKHIFSPLPHPQLKNHELAPQPAQNATNFFPKKPLRLENIIL
jgi:hypothetical protein